VNVIFSTVILNGKDIFLKKISIENDIDGGNERYISKMYISPTRRHINEIQSN